jgi:hypothetical protein
MANGLAIGIQNQCAASTIAYGHAVSSIQDKPVAFVLGDKVTDRLVHLGHPAPASLALHDELLCPEQDSLEFSVVQG